jgi:hypothetical protein
MTRIWEPVIAVGWPLAVGAVALSIWLAPSDGSGPQSQPPVAPSAEPNPPPSQSAEPSSLPTEQADTPTSALEELANIPVATQRAGDYVRDAFGPGWGDPDRNGCDARNDTLARDLTEVEFRPDTNNCVVVSGVLADPYTGIVIHFVKGNETSELVQIDHVVPLAWAWGYGASTWTDQQRIDFFSNAENLLAVDGATNQAKSDSGPSDWMPPNPAYRCEYAERFVAVVAAGDLSMPDEDRQVIQRLLQSC